MSILIRNATILAMGGPHGREPFGGDIHIVGDRIQAIGPDIEGVEAETVIDGRDRLVMPGLSNGHLHSSEALLKGRYDNMPLELWMLFSYPILGASALDARLIYLRTMLVAMELLRTGVTSVSDDVYEAPRQDIDRMDAVFQAYRDIGMRATVSGHVIDRTFLDSIPFAREVVPADLQREVDALPGVAPEDYLAFARTALQRYHNLDGRLRFMMAPSAPQRCSPDLMHAVDALARQHRTPFHTHIARDQGAGGHRAAALRQVAGALHARSRPAARRRRDRAFDLGHRRGHRDHGRRQGLDHPQRDLEPEARRRHRADPQAVEGRRQRGARLGRHLLQRHAAHVRRDACGGPVAQRLDAGLSAAGSTPARCCMPRRSAARRAR